MKDRSVPSGFDRRNTWKDLTEPDLNKVKEKLTSFPRKYRMAWIPDAIHTASPSMVILVICVGASGPVYNEMWGSGTVFFGRNEPTYQQTTRPSFLLPIKPMLVQGRLEDVFLDHLSLPCEIEFAIRMECGLWQVRELWMAQKDVVQPFFFHLEWPSVLNEVFCEEVDERYRLTLESGKD